MHEGSVSVTYHPGVSKRGLEASDVSPRFWHRYVQRLGWVQVPFLLLRRSYWGLVLALNWWDIVDEHVLVGGALMFNDITRLRRQGVGAIVNLCAERHDKPQHLQAAGMEYLWLPVMDTHPPTVLQICQGLAWIEARLGAGRMVYIHCAAGMGRSVTLLACWYLYTHGMNVPQVLTFLKKRRPQTSLSRRQRQRIEEMAHLLSRTAGRLPLPRETGQRAG